MLIYGNTPGDIGKKFIKNKYKILGITVGVFLFIVLVL